MTRFSSLLVLGAFSLTVLASMVNAACSSPGDVDSGTSEHNVTAGSPVKGAPAVTVGHDVPPPHDRGRRTDCGER